MDSQEINCDLSGFTLRLRGMDSDLAGRFRREWKGFLAEPVADPFLDLAVSVEGREATGDGSAGSSGSEDLRMGVGTLEIRSNEPDCVRLATASLNMQYYALVNLLTEALGRSLPRRDAFLLHSAGVLIEDRAFVLVGAAGAGKTTWARLARSAGARFLSDDVVLVDASGKQVTVHSTPIRGDWPEPIAPGNWPLAALLLPQHGPEVRLEPASEIRVYSRIAANLLFLDAHAKVDERMVELLRRMIDQVACYTLTYAKEPSFMETLRAIPRP